MHPGCDRLGKVRGGPRRRPLAGALAGLSASTLLLIGAARGERLPISLYTTSDGLASDAVSCIVRDSRGFLWFCHPGQLSRFDGQRFVTYGPEHGLPQAAIHDMLETRAGIYLFATGEGAFRYDPHGGARMFVPVDPDEKQPPRLYALAEDSAGGLWAGSPTGLFRLEPDCSNFRYRRAAFDVTEGPGARVNTLLETGDGTLWIGTREGLVRRGGDGRLTRFRAETGLPGNDIRCLLEDREKRIWIGTTSGLARLAPVLQEGAVLASDLYLPGRDIPMRLVSAVHEAADGAILVGSHGFGELRREAGIGRGLRWFTASNGVSREEITSFAEDIAGNLWIGTEAGGAMCLAPHGFVSFGEAEGFVNPRIDSIFENREGELCASAPGYVYRLEGEGFVPTPLPIALDDQGWGWNQWLFQDREGDWWIPSRTGVLRFTGVRRVADLARAKPVVAFRADPAQGEGGVFRLYEDSKGDVWIGTIGAERKVRFTRWQRRSGALEQFTLADPSLTTAPTAFREDSRGGLWIGFYLGGVARFRDGRFQFFAPGDGPPPGLVRALHLDRRGRLWIATEGGGAAYIEDPAAEHPAFVPFGMANGLASHVVTAIAEDGRGRLFFGTDRGVDRFTPESGAVEHFSTADGLPNAFINVAFRDRNGALWFGTLGGAARLDPDAGRPLHPPPVFIEHVRIAGAPHSVSDLGEAEIPQVELPPGSNRVQIQFGGINFESSGSLRFQYRLEGAGREWSEPQAYGSVDLANLSPGVYRFLVRAVNPAGLPSTDPASFAFVVLRPFWQRWWFLALMVSALAGIAVLVHRVRVARVVAMERIRTHIASDLHDDIGASLSRIAIQSEVLRRRADERDTEGKEALASMAHTSREMVDAMGDIVWAINPKRDQLGDVVHRMRRFCSDALTSAGVEFSFDAPEHGREIRLGADIRRQAFLVLKESVNNALRHSGCSRLDVRLDLSKDRLELKVSDNGRGFDAASSFEGNGLANMHRRAAGAGGALSIDSAPGRGTTVRLVIPLRRRLWRRGNSPGSYLFM